MLELVYFIMTVLRRKSVSNQYESNLFVSLSLRLLLAVLIGLIAISITKIYTKCDHKENINDKVLRYWGVCLSKWNNNSEGGSLATMNKVFKNLGYVKVNASEGDAWDVLWSFEYGFSKSLIHKKTKLFEPLFRMNYTFLPHQRVNHIPGIFHMTNKVNLCKHLKLKYSSFSF